MTSGTSVRCEMHSATISARCCVMRHLKRKEGKASHMPWYPDCARCRDGRERAAALALVGELPTARELSCKFRPDDAEQRAAKLEWLRTHLPVEE